MSTMSAQSDVSLWLKVDPFYIGALPVPPHPKLSLHVSLLVQILEGKSVKDEWDAQDHLESQSQTLI